MTKRSSYLSPATSVRTRSRTSPARPAFSAAVIVFVYAAHTSAPVTWLSAEEKKKIFSGNVRKVYPRFAAA